MIEKRETYLGAGLKWFMIVTVGLFAMLFVVPKQFAGDNMLFDVVLWAMGLVIAFFVMRSWRIQQQILARVGEFDKLAAKLGYKRDEVVPKRTTIFRLIEQRDPRFINTMSGKGWRYGDYTYNIYRRTKHGDYKAVEVYYSVIELDLPRRLPNMFFDSPGAHGLQFLPHLDESQRTSLEGDFDEHFTTYFPQHYHIDARSIISPEVMVAMIDSGVGDVEIAGDKLYLYSPMLPVEDVPSFIKNGQEIHKKLADHAVFYKDERLVDATNRKGVSVFGKTLRKKARFPWLMLTFSGCFLVYLWLRSVPADAFLPLAIGLGGLTFLEAHSSWWKVRRKNKAMDKRYERRVVAQNKRSKRLLSKKASPKASIRAD